MMEVVCDSSCLVLTDCVKGTKLAMSLTYFYFAAAAAAVVVAAVVEADHAATKVRIWV